MAKTHTFRTVSLGSEPEPPDVQSVAEWVGLQRGSDADLASYLLESSLSPQVEAGVDTPCAGGIFYNRRIMESLSGIRSGDVTGELGSDPTLLQADARRVLSFHRGTRVGLPAPHILGISDSYYSDEEEVDAALCRQYRLLLRAMRDEGIPGHVILAERAVEIEIEQLAGKKVFFFLKEPDAESLSLLLEYQRSVAVKTDHLAILRDLWEEHEISSLLLLDPGEGDIREILGFLDPDRIQVGGYCSGEGPDYWEGLVRSATISL